MADLQLLVKLAVADQLLSPLQRNAQALGDFDKQLAKVRHSAEGLQSLGRNLGMVGAGMAAPVGASLGAFTDLESAQVQLKNAMSTVDGVDENWDKINKQAVIAGNLYPGTTADFLNLAAGMKLMGMDAKTMTSGAFQGAAALQVMFKLNPAEAGEAFVQMGKGFKIAGQDSLAFADAIQRVSYSTGLKLPEIKEAMKYAGTGLSQLGVKGLDNSKTVLAMMGALKQSNVEGSQIGTTFQGAFNHIADMGARLRQGRGEVMKEAKESMAKAGVNLQFFDKGGKFLGMENFVNQFDKLKGLSEQSRLLIGKALFGEEGAKMALLDKGKMQEATRAMLQQEALQKRLDRITNTLGNKAEAAKGSLVNLAASIGEKLAPALVPVLDKMNVLLGRMQEWTDKHPNWTAAIAGTVGALGALLVAAGGTFFVVGKIKGTLADSMEAFRAFRGVVGSAAGNVKLFMDYSKLAGGWRSGLNMMLGDGGKLSRFLATDLTPIAKGAWSTLTDFKASPVLNGLKWLKSSVLSMLPPLWGAITATWAWTVALLANPITWVVVGIVALATAGVMLWKNWDKVTAWFKGTWAWFQGMWAKVPGWAKWLMPFISAPMFIIQNWGKIKGALGAVWDWVKGFAGRMWDAGSNIVKIIAKGMLAAALHPVEAIKAVVAKVRKFLPFSPAKEGPLSDLHKLRLVETIADSIRPDSLVGRMQSVMGATRAVLGRGLAVGASLAAAPLSLAAGGAGRPSIQVTIQVDARGAAPGVGQEIERAILKAAPALKRELERLGDSDSRRRF